MPRIDASAFVICKNEEANIGWALDSLRDFAEIIVVDSGSTDNTLKIVAKYPCKIYQQEWLGFAQQKAWAMAKCENEWVFNLDADEAISDSLRQSLIRFLQDPGDYCGLEIPRRDSFAGRWKHNSTKQNRFVRMARKSSARYSDASVHEELLVDGPVFRINTPILHFGELDISRKLEKLSYYSTLRVRDKHQKGKRGSRLKLLVVFPVMFIKSYILRREFLNGWRGLVSAVMNAFYAFIKEAKLMEMAQKEKAVTPGKNR